MGHLVFGAVLGTIYGIIMMSLLYVAGREDDKLEEALKKLREEREKEEDE